MKRYGMVIRLRPEKREEYIELHRAVWPGVLETIRQCKITNYSIFLKDDLLFSYYEYIGEDYEADMRKMADDPVTQKWWTLCDPCQQPLEACAEGEWWAQMAEVFHFES